ncbi:MAG: sugar phosphate isomerase/epimerase family protein [Planctomycetota bacterium]
MTTVRIGVQTKSLRTPLRRALATAGRLGAEGVQVDLRAELPLAECSASALREVRKLLGDHRLQAASVAFPTRRGYADPAELDRRVAATRQAMSVGADLGARVLVAPVGAIPDDDASFDPLVETLTALALHGERVGARLALRTGADADRLATLLERLPDGVAGVDFHPAEVLRRGGSPGEALPRFGPRVLHVTAADAVHDFSASRVVDVPLGRGTVDFPALLAGLDGYEYRGWVTIERDESPDPAGEVGAAVEFLRTVLREG